MKAGTLVEEKPEQLPEQTDQKSKAQTLAEVQEEIALIKAQRELKGLQEEQQEKEKALQEKTDQLIGKEERLAEWEAQLSARETQMSLQAERAQRDIKRGWATLEAAKDKMVAELGKASKILLGHIDVSRCSSYRDYDSKIPFEQIQVLIDTLEKVKKWRNLK